MQMKQGPESVKKTHKQSLMILNYYYHLQSNETVSVFFLSINVKFVIFMGYYTIYI
jgi:hypothetical protein